MYKPTLYITMEADPSRYNPEGEGLASRLWSFTAPVTLAPSPTMELGLKVRMKCVGRPYWGMDDASEDNWKNVAWPFLDHKLKAIIDVLYGCNVKRYNHYEGAIHFTWLKLQLAPYELRVRLDADAEDNDYIPDVLGLVERVRDLVNQDAFRAFSDGDDNIAVYLPCRADVEELKARRAEEAEAHAAWQKAQEADGGGAQAAKGAPEGRNDGAAAQTETTAACSNETAAEAPESNPDEQDGQTIEKDAGTPKLPKSPSFPPALKSRRSSSSSRTAPPSSTT